MTRPRPYASRIVLPAGWLRRPSKVWSNSSKPANSSLGASAGVYLGLALHLGDLAERLVEQPAPGVRLVDRPAVTVGPVVHHAVAHVAVVRNDEALGAPAAVLLQIRPEVLRPRGIEVGEGQRRGVAAEDHVAVDGAAGAFAGGGVRRPLVADEGGETARLVEVVGGGDDALPRRPAHGGDVEPGHLARRLRPPRAETGAVPVAASGIAAEVAADRARRQHGVRILHRHAGADDLAVIGHRHEVERPAAADRLAHEQHFLAAREAVGVLGTEPRSEQVVRVHRQHRVDVEVAEEHVPVRVDRRRRAVSRGGLRNRRGGLGRPPRSRPAAPDPPPMPRW